MNRINELFNQKSKKILSVYFTAGYPALNDTVQVIEELSDRGIDMIEIGIPFSDPIADGPVIQNAANRSIRNGMSLKLLFAQLENIRETVQIPLLLMGYMNPVMQYGFENFCKKCSQTGIDGMIIPDLPFDDYITTFKPIADRYNLRIIMLITPETSEERIRLIDRNTEGFIYMVSSASTTGSQSSFDLSRKEYFKRIGQMNLHNPRLIGFGISNKQTFDAANEYASGAIVGSKFVQLLQECPTVRDGVSALLQTLGENR